MVEWTAHRFSGGVLALDLINTVVWANLPERRTDRLINLEQTHAFAKAATRFRAEELAGQNLFAPASEAEFTHLLRLRAVLDRWLRPQPGNVQPSWATVFSACARASNAAVPDETALSLGAACARSAMVFITPQSRERLKQCPACHWLYQDRSKNNSRAWCDMKVCGNRAKAQTYYARHKLELARQPT
jgi:predicted RNA-binding Zn ribbon-like protein